MNTETTVDVTMSLMVLCGAFFMLAAIIAGQKMGRHIPVALVGRWRFVLMLMLFFLGGYLSFFIILISGITIPTELVTAPVFLAGAVFVYIMIKLTRATIGQVKQAEENLQALNATLEQRVADRTRDLDMLNATLEQRVVDRTRDLDQSRAFLQTVLDSLHEEVMTIDADTFTIVRANAAFLSKHGVREDAVIGKTCFDITHHRKEICSSSEEICPLRETVKTGRHAMVVHTHYDMNENKEYAEVSTSPIRNVDGRIARIVHVTRDITERKLAEEAMRESEERYRRLIELSPDGITVLVDGKFVFINPAGAKLLGAMHPYQLIGMSALDVVHPDFRETERKRIQQLEKNTEMVAWIEEKFVRLDGQEIDVEAAAVHFSYLGKPAVQGIFRDITERKLAAQRIEHLALHDTLTGLPNRRLFFDRLNQVLAVAKRNQNIFALLYMDLDEFKTINDTYGHEVGDQLLREVSRRLVSGMRESDTIARMGGDEFIGICRMITSPEEAEIVARKIIAAQSEPFDLKGGRCWVGISIGISLYPIDGEDAESLLVKADKAMYRVKRSSKGRYLRYSKK